MGLTVKRESNFGSLFDKFASLPDDVKENEKRVDAADKKKAATDKKNLKDKK
ncbi:SPJ_0845 family protein [Companilactobacillus halodurans]|uniref:SPJ_0845 family protein n=1 Tax=Companilactobacillus halodurans TaxID=2584183 RepID=UPI001295492D|nr:SPJ_0845 family protein [Companilactobacillus halodurans]